MIYYIHGYQSSIQSTKAKILKEKLNVKPIKYRNCPPEQLIIKDCINQIQDYIKNDQNIILIGSSLGGLLAVKVAMNNKNVKQLILINPALIPKKQDISKIKDMPQRILTEMKDPNIFKKIKINTTIILGKNDKVVSNKWGENYAKIHDANIIYLEDDHRLSKNTEKLPEIIKPIIE